LKSIEAMRIGIIAPSSVVPQIELKEGVQKLELKGFQVELHPQCHMKHLFFSGTHTVRAKAIYDFAMREDLDVLWCARGGYGAAHLLPLLEEYTRKNGKPPQKMLVGYSDATALHEFVRTRWKWKTLHAPMPAVGEFLELKKEEFSVLEQLIRGEFPKGTPFWKKPTLKVLAGKAPRELKGELIGGNLSVWTSLLGTPYAPKRVNGKLLFLEEVTEPLYKIDRMLEQLRQAKALEGLSAIILGDFTNCEDKVPQVRVSLSDSEKQRSLRKKMSKQEGLSQIFGELSERTAVPIFEGAPVGHGPGRFPLPLGAPLSVRHQMVRGSRHYDLVLV
jgi:muramoyltetrapeptide carboxypeptidase